VSINPFSKFANHCLIIRDEVRKLEVGTLERLVGIDALDRIDLDAAIAKILVEESAKLILADGVIRYGIHKTVSTSKCCLLHSLSELESGLTCPHSLGESVDLAFLMEEPVEKTDALRINIRTHDRVAKSDVLVVIEFAKSLGTIVESLAILKISFGVGTSAAREHTVGGHMDNLGVSILGYVCKEMREV